eukprot:637929-Pyramimonas_sp.AAC.2
MHLGPWTAWGPRWARMARAAPKTQRGRAEPSTDASSPRPTESPTIHELRAKHPPIAKQDDLGLR